MLNSYSEKMEIANKPSVDSAIGSYNHCSNKYGLASFHHNKIENLTRDCQEREDQFSQCKELGFKKRRRYSPQATFERLEDASAYYKSTQYFPKMSSSSAYLYNLYEYKKYRKMWKTGYSYPGQNYNRKYMVAGYKSAGYNIKKKGNGWCRKMLNMNSAISSNSSVKNDDVKEEYEIVKCVSVTTKIRRKAIVNRSVTWKTVPVVKLIENNFTGEIKKSNESDVRDKSKVEKELYELFSSALTISEVPSDSDEIKLRKRKLESAENVFKLSKKSKPS